MQCARARLRAQLASGTAATARFLGGLTADEWRAPTPCGGWNAGEVAAHLLEVEEKVTGPLVRGDRHGPEQPVDNVRGLAPAELAARYEESGQRILRAFDALTPVDLNTVVDVRGPGRLPLADALRFRGFEQFNHTNDILLGLGRTGSFLPDLVGHGLDFVRNASPHLVAGERLGDARARFVFDFDGEEPWLLTIADGRATPTPWNGEDANAVIHGDGAHFLLGLLLEKVPWRRVLRSRRVRIRGRLRTCRLLRCCVPLLVPES